MHKYSLLALLTLGAACTPTQGSQDTAAVGVDTQRRQLEWQRTTLLAMADSMPETLYRDRVTPEQRDFAEQIHHAAEFIAFIGGNFMADSAPTLPDTATALNSGAGMTSYLNAVYDFAVAALENQSADDRAEVVDFFGLGQKPKWELWDQAYLHTVWTAGQIVANFRKHGMAPPEFVFF
jgi:hypothetical protein